MLLREKGDMAIVRVRKDATLLRGNGKMAILFTHRDYHLFIVKRFNSGFESQTAFQAKLLPNMSSISSCAMILILPFSGLQT
jgi:hypothetical protein